MDAMISTNGKTLLKKCPESVRANKMTTANKRGSKFWEGRVFRHHKSADNALYYVKLQCEGPTR
jgi:hypothetical protein